MGIDGKLVKVLDSVTPCSMKFASFADVKAYIEMLGDAPINKYTDGIKKTPAIVRKKKQTNTKKTLVAKKAGPATSKKIAKKGK